MSEFPSTLQNALKERYEILRELGRGGMAIVYAARDIRMNREVAIKVLLPDLAMAMGAERFTREIEIAGHLSNPHILAVFDSGNADGQLYYVMPLIRGESLRDRLDREKQLPVDEALRISIEVAEALDYAHRQGVVHRDIKPENILLSEGHAIVADFGIARAVSSMNEGSGLTATGMTLGTASYMSPEQSMAEKNIDGRSDIYSLACVTYEMLAGQPPYTGPNAMAIMARQAMEAPPSLTLVRDAIADEVEETVFQALAKSPVDRFQTAAEFADALQDCLLVTPTTTRRTAQLRMTATTKARRAVRQRRKVMTISAIAVGALAVIAGAWKVLGTAGAARPPAISGGLDRKSIAVLYFKDRSSDGSLAHVADALTEGLIDELSEVNGLHVVSKNGSAQFRNSTIEPDSIARALQAGSIIEGDVESVGSNLRVTTRLLDGNGTQIGATPATDLPATQLLAVRDSVIAETAEMLRKLIGPEVRLSESRAGTAVVEAWSLMQRAERVRKDAIRQRASGAVDSAAANLVKADSLLRLSHDLDKNWSEPVVLRGQVAYDHAALESQKQKKEQLLNSAIELASQALGMQPNQAVALALRGRARSLMYQQNMAPDAVARGRLLDSAEADLKAATEADGSQAAAYLALSQLYYDREDNVEALLAARRAYEADVFLASQDANVRQLFWTSYDLKRFDSAREWCLKGAQRFPANRGFVDCQLWLLISPEQGTRDIGLAWKLADSVKKMAPEKTREFESRLAQILVAGALARNQLADSARHVLEKARASNEIDPEEALSGYEAIIRVIIGDKDEAVKLLRRYVQLHPTHEFSVDGDFHWWWAPLRNHPGFMDVAKRKR